MYERGGNVMHVKQPKALQFKLPLHDSLLLLKHNRRKSAFLLRDFSMCEQPALLQFAFQTLDKSPLVLGRHPIVGSEEDNHNLISCVTCINVSSSAMRFGEIDHIVLRHFTFGVGIVLNPMTAVSSDIVGQDIDKACVGKSLSTRTQSFILLEDYRWEEALANFDKERISERVVHARGASAKGSFEVTHEASYLTCIELLWALGFRTPVIVRFSIILHKRGSPENLRDPCGFAVQCYTSEGTLDLMENNFPVPLIRSGLQFPDTVYSFTPKPKSHNWRIIDCYSYHTASLHMFPFSFDDVGVSQDYRHMEGFGINPYTLINKAGKEYFGLSVSPWPHNEAHPIRTNTATVKIFDDTSWKNDIIQACVGHCLGGDDRPLMYEVLPVGSLENYLFTATLSMILSAGTELTNYLAVNTTRSIVVVQSADGGIMCTEFNINFSVLSCEIASAATYPTIAITLSLMDSYFLHVQYGQAPTKLLTLDPDDLRTQHAAAWLGYPAFEAVEQ